MLYVRMELRHFRRHWKKYVAGQLLGMVLTSYLINKHRERNVIREYCNIAKTFGEKKSSMLERPKRIMVFLNRTANNTNAKINFTKYAAPLLHLSGLDVTVVESEYQGHIQMLMNYVDPTTDGIVIAGGDGTVMEVINGLMRRQDAEVAKSMVLGILPLGKENQSFGTFFPSANNTSLARSVGEATVKVLHSVTKQVPVIEIHPEKGRRLFALSSIQWGAFKDAFQNRDRFWVFGKLRLLASYLSTTIRHWPGDTSQSLWTFHSIPHTLSATSPKEPINRDTEQSQQSMPSMNQPGQLDSLIEEGIAAFKLSSHSSSGEQHLSLITWPLTLLPKSDFLKHGWCMTTRQRAEACEVSGRDFIGTEFSLSPNQCSPAAEGDQQLSVDGEQYEPVPMHVKLNPNYLTVFT